MNFLLKNIFLKLNPEISQKILLKYFKYIQKIKIFNKKINPKQTNIQCMGLNFPNILGCAAGLDKNGEYIQTLSNLGFGFIEIGTITPNPQLGNDKPRIFRLVEADSIINRMGFNNQGVDQIVKNIKIKNFKGILGINIGKNKDTTNENSKHDYIFCMKKIYQYASYITINISSPNTKNLRLLQYKDYLEELLFFIKTEQLKLSQKHLKYVPLLIKISPDINDLELIHIINIIIQYNIDGIIATNTTIERSLVHNLKYGNEKGGLSGKSLFTLSTEIIKKISKETNGKIPIIANGGIDSLITAKEKIKAGANLLQIYTSLIYQGPKIIHKIINYL